MAYAVLKIFGAAEDADFYAHEAEGKVTSVDFREADGVFLGGEDDFSLAFFAAVDGVEDFLLGEAVVIGEAFGVYEVGAEVGEGLFEAFGLGDTAEGGDFFTADEVEIESFSAEDIFEVEGVVDAFDDTGGGVIAGDALSEFGGISVAFGDEDGAGAGQVFGGFAQGAAGEEVFVAEGLLSIDEDDVHAAAAEFPVLESVIEQECIAAEGFDGVAAGFDAVFIDEDDHVLEVGGEHIGFVAGGFGIEQKGASIGDDARGGSFFAEQQFIEESFTEGGWFGPVAAGEDGDITSLVFEFAGEFFDHGGFAGATDREVTDGDDLDAEGGIAEDAVVVEELSTFDGEEEDFGEAEEGGADECGAFAVALFENDLENESLEVFDPSLEVVTHGGRVCQPLGGEAS